MATTTVLKVEGMTCGHCEMSVQEALDELDGVRAARADRNTGDVEVTYEEGKVTDEQFRGAVEEAGYALKS
ncbi:copper-binding protein [Rubrobacter tropicus]|uniref:Copper-binding protein n=1 Tax=Rubrobacter tropicus TaxID=2653851 RepID=A0A6G8QDB1_9ACTN|nr:cation transporter [Rubrobacter tropicus]QIN84485.1 copper-binding protein [Rubrobacter tropicus]